MFQENYHWCFNGFSKVASAVYIWTILDTSSSHSCPEAEICMQWGMPRLVDGPSDRAPELIKFHFRQGWKCPDGQWWGGGDAESMTATGLGCVTMAYNSSTTFWWNSVVGCSCSVMLPFYQKDSIFPDGRLSRSESTWASDSYFCVRCGKLGPFCGPFIAARACLLWTCYCWTWLQMAPLVAYDPTRCGHPVERRCSCDVKLAALGSRSQAEKGLTNPKAQKNAWRNDELMLDWHELFRLQFVDEVFATISATLVWTDLYEVLNFASFFLGPIFLNKRAPNTGEQSAHFQGLKTQKYWLLNDYVFFRRVNSPRRIAILAQWPLGSKAMALEEALCTIRNAALAANGANQVHVDMVMAAVEELCVGRSMGSTEKRKSGGVQYKLEKLLEAFFLGRLMKNAGELPQAIWRAFSFLLGPHAAEICRQGLLQRKIDVPSAASLSRARLKIDVLLMRLRIWACISVFRCHVMLILIYFIRTSASSKPKPSVTVANRGRQAFSDKPNVFISLSCDASPQQGVDYQMTLEDMIDRDRSLTKTLEMCGTWCLVPGFLVEL